VPLAANAAASRSASTAVESRYRETMANATATRAYSSHRRRIGSDDTSAVVLPRAKSVGVAATRAAESATEGGFEAFNRRAADVPNRYDEG
jgi:hypothetical protein